MSITLWMNQNCVVYPYTWTLLSNKKEQLLIHATTRRKCKSFMLNENVRLKGTSSWFLVYDILEKAKTIMKETHGVVTKVWVRRGVGVVDIDYKEARRTFWEWWKYCISRLRWWLCLATQSCPTLCDPVDCSPLDSSVHGKSPSNNTGFQVELSHVGNHKLSFAKWKWQWKSLSHVPLFETPWTIPSMEFSRPEYWGE